jgi:hypothetical protein
MTNDEQERMWKEAFMALFKVISRHSPGGTEKNKKSLSIVGLCAES